MSNIIKINTSLLKQSSETIEEYSKNYKRKSSTILSYRNSSSYDLNRFLNNMSQAYSSLSSNLDNINKRLSDIIKDAEGIENLYSNKKSSFVTPEIKDITSGENNINITLFDDERIFR